jgi:hypothetical protein
MKRITKELYQTQKTLLDFEKLRYCSTPLLDYYSIAKAKLEKLGELGND